MYCVFLVQLLNVDRSPTMNQYVGLLELICESSSIPTAEVLQDVSVLYARLGENIQIAALLCLSVSPVLSAAQCRHSRHLQFAVVSLLIAVFLSSAAFKCKSQIPGDLQDNHLELKLDQGYCSTLKGQYSYVHNSCLHYSAVSL